MQKDEVADIAAKVTEAFLARKKKLVLKLMGPAPSYSLQTSIVRNFATRAAEAREAGDHDIVSRLLAGAYSFRPADMTKDMLRQIFIATGAVGHKPPQKRSQGCRSSDANMARSATYQPWLDSRSPAGESVGVGA